ncbi:MAG: hypothetical protein BMS9Abin26_0018 [Gammaproteobacteria bacterium]|nr:MAG: hypothetical protein BMS9Abin26_0018 [Gammaproteobacteria bacterium]
MAYAGEFKDFNGNPASVDDYLSKDKWTVVMFWASDCHICNEEIAQYVNFSREHSDKDARVLGISLDGDAKLADAREFVKRHKVDFPNLIGEAEDVASFYMSSSQQAFAGTPSFFIYSPAGELRIAQVGAVPAELIAKFIEEQTAKPQDKNTP